MILEISADDPQFRGVVFRRGLNVVLADRTEAAGEKDTTNGLGKSTLIEIIDFCLGGRLKNTSGLRSEHVKDTTFTLKLMLKGQSVEVSRSPATQTNVSITGHFTDWPEQPEVQDDGTMAMHVDKWKAVLGWALFSLRGKVNTAGKYKPSLRSVLPYFLRYRSDAFLTPFKHFANQKTWNVQLVNALLLGLDWEKAGRWQELKDQTNALKALRDAVKTGAIKGELSTIGELEAQKAQFAEQVEKQQKALEDFQVLEEYRDIEREANSLTAEMHSLSNANLVARRRIDHYQKSLSSEQPPVEDRLQSLYNEAGVVLPDALKRTLDEAKRFNETIVKNRKQFVFDEIASLEKDIGARDATISKLVERRQSLLRILSGRGALDEMVQLQERHSGTQQELKSIELRIEQLRQVTSRSDEIKVETVSLKKSALTDYEERREVWTKALSLFAKFSARLYEHPGRLVIDINDTGYKFDVEIDGSSSEGVGKMKIFCYDLALITFARQREFGLKFLIHDSTIFDGVDPRQRSHAIELAAEQAEEHGFQYILAMNRDMLPSEDFTEGFDVNRFVVLSLTDTDPSGSLMGFRF